MFVSVWTPVFAQDEPMKAIRRFLISDDGPTSVEYAVMLALIVAVCIATIKSVGDQTSGIWANNEEKLQEAGF